METLDHLNEMNHSCIYRFYCQKKNMKDQMKQTNKKELVVVLLSLSIKGISTFHCL